VFEDSFKASQPYCFTQLSFHLRLVDGFGEIVRHSERTVRDVRRLVVVRWDNAVGGPDSGRMSVFWRGAVFVWEVGIGRLLDSTGLSNISVKRHGELSSWC
jgi:hypothetical protein